MYYVREGVVNTYAMTFVVPVPANIADLEFSWQSLVGHPVRIHEKIFSYNRKSNIVHTNCDFSAGLMFNYLALGCLFEAKKFVLSPFFFLFFFTYMLRALPLQTEAYSYPVKENRVLGKKLLSSFMRSFFKRLSFFNVFRHKRNHDSRIRVSASLKSIETGLPRVRESKTFPPAINETQQCGTK